MLTALGMNGGDLPLVTDKLTQRFADKHLFPDVSGTRPQQRHYF